MPAFFFAELNGISRKSGPCSREKEVSRYERAEVPLDRQPQGKGVTA
jgi:hypothetical protein